MGIINAAVKSLGVVCASCVVTAAIAVCAAWVRKGRIKSGFAVLLVTAWLVITWSFYIRA